MLLSRKSRDVRSQRSVKSFLQVTRVRLSIIRAPLYGSTTCSFVLGFRHFTTSDVEKRSSQPPNLRMRDTCNEALIQRSPRDLDGDPCSSRFRHSRLGAPNSWSLSLRTSEFMRSLDLCHLSSSDGRSQSYRDFTTHEV